MWGELWGSMIWGGAAVPLMSPGGLMLLMGAILAIGVAMRRRHARWAVLALAALVLVVPIAADTDTLFGLIDFTNGTIADANDVNANFDAVETEVTDNANDIVRNTIAINNLALQGVVDRQMINNSGMCTILGLESVNVMCTGGRKVFGGGCSGDLAVVVSSSYPSSDFGWTCGFQCNASSSFINAWAICAKTLF